MVVNVIDVGLGNINSIEHWIRDCHFFPRRVQNIEQLTTGPIIIPGVASAGEYMDRLKSLSLDKEIIKRCQSGQKIIGICLGFQILSNYSEEDSGTKCLGLLNGVTRYIKDKKTHNGWEDIHIDTRREENNVSFPKKRVKKIDGRVYFNHELMIELEDNIYTHVLSNGVTSYAFKNNIFGMQFHPEKSQKTGQDLLKLII
jgi:glutamine amidotransferase